MNSKALYGILIVLLIPVTAYFILKRFTDKDILMPPHFIPDSTTTITRNGKQYIDTVWHKVADFNLKNQLGQNVSWKDMEDKIVVVNFFFTHCPTICPTLTRNMKELQENIHSPEKVGLREAGFVQFLSFSIDPERDSVQALKKWADRFQVDPRNWFLLTGDKKQIYDLSINEMKIPAEDGGEIDSNFVHTDIFVLLDKNKNIRGYYHTLITDHNTGGFRTDTASLAKLSNDIIFLSMEKDKKKKFFLADKLPLIAAVFLAAILGIAILFFIIKKEKHPHVDLKK
jgi:protein SCO1/2